MSYCASLTDAQVINVYFDEKARIKRFGPGPTRDAAEALMREAELEAARRGLDLDKSLWTPQRPGR